MWGERRASLLTLRLEKARTLLRRSPFYSISYNLHRLICHFSFSIGTEAGVCRTRGYNRGRAVEGLQGGGGEDYGGGVGGGQRGGGR